MMKIPVWDVRHDRRNPGFVELIQQNVVFAEQLPAVNDRDVDQLFILNTLVDAMDTINGYE